MRVVTCDPPFCSLADLRHRKEYTLKDVADMHDYLDASEEFARRCRQWAKDHPDDDV